MKVIHLATIILALMLCISAASAAKAPLKISGSSNNNGFITTISPDIQSPDGYVKVTSFIGSTRDYYGVKIKQVTITRLDLPYSVSWK